MLFFYCLKQHIFASYSIKVQYLVQYAKGMPVIDKKERKAIKRRIAAELQKRGITKIALARKSGYHYNTVKWALNPEQPGWSAGIIAAAELIINPPQEQPSTTQCQD